MSQQWPGQKVGGSASVAAPQPQVPAARPVLRPLLSQPDPRADREEARDETRTNIAVQSDLRAQDNDRFNRVTTYRKEFLTEPTVRQFREVENATRQIVDLAKRENDQPGPGDIALIISFMKALDPGSVVRETEFATAENAGGVPETVRNAYNKLLNGGRLTPEIKQEFARTATSFYNARLNGYNSFAQDYRGLISAEGADPDAQGVRLAEPMAFDMPGQGGGGGGPGYSIVSPEESARVWGEPTFDQNGNPVGADYTGDLYDAQGNFVSVNVRVTDERPDPRDEMGLLGSIGETITGSERSTPEIEGLPDAMTMPELNSFSFASAAAGLGTMLTGPQETVEVIRQQFPGTQVRQDAKGNFILRSSIDGQEYAIKPGFRLSDIPRAIGALAAFTPAGRATTAAGAFAGGAATQAGIEATQAATGGTFDTGDVAVAGAGGVAGQQLGRIVSAARSARPAARPATVGGQAVQAADNLNAQTGSNMNLMPADVGGPGLRNATGAMSKLPSSASILNRRAQQLTREAEKAKNFLVGLAGGKAEPEIAGEQALEGAQSWLKTSRAKVNALYTRARNAGGDEPVDLANARQVLDGHIAELEQTPGAVAGLERLKALRADLDRPFPVEGVKRMRTRLRDDFGSDGLRATDIERRVGEVIDAADGDISEALLAAGKDEAASLYRQAATAHRERLQVIDDVLAPIIGRKSDAPRSGEEIIATLEQAAKGKSARLGKFMAILPEEDRGVVRGTLLDRLGKATNSGQDATGEAFSLETFLTRWSAMSDRAKTTVFGGELRAALDDLAKVAAARRETNKFVNYSNTGAPVGYVAAGGLVMAGPKGWAVLAGDALTGALLQSPSIARWLAKAPSNPNAARPHIASLTKIAKTNPAIAQDALGLQRQLQAQFQEGALPLAAEGQSERAGSNTRTPGTQ